MLEEIEIGDTVFGVFPLLHPGACDPWFWDLGEVLDMCSQVLEVRRLPRMLACISATHLSPRQRWQGLSFCHENLVAHRDAFFDNLLISFVGGRTDVDYSGDIPEPRPFRSLFPCRYYLIDFELAVAFDPSSDPATRLVSGLPTQGSRRGQYGRPKPPELEGNEPYCPFKLDIWQTGREFKAFFAVRRQLDLASSYRAETLCVHQHLGDVCPAMPSLIEALMTSTPADRPTAEQAFRQVEVIRASLSQDQLAQRVVVPECLYVFDD